MAHGNGYPRFKLAGFQLTVNERNFHSNSWLNIKLGEINVFIIKVNSIQPNVMIIGVINVIIVHIRKLEIINTYCRL